MKSSYKNMRAFWLDAKNLENRKGVIEIGPEKIVAAGVEMAVADGTSVKYVLVATNSLGDSSFYFENNSKSGLGGFVGGHGNAPLQEAAARMLAHASKLTAQMTPVNGQDLPAPTQSGHVVIFALSKEKLFFKELAETDARNPENDFYPVFAYSQQVIGHFSTQSAAQKPQGNA